MKSKGFSLIELAIVLVIIGLLVSGVLVGRELILQAKIRHAIMGFEDLDRAWNTFYLKYNGIPGDIKDYSVISPICDESGNGNGDGLYQPTEYLCVWQQLDAAGLYTWSNSQIAYSAENVWTGDSDILLRVTPYTGQDTPYKYKAGVTSLSSHIDDLQTVYKNQVVYNPEFVSTLDEKIDDGKPYTGILMGLRGWDIAHTALQPCFSNPTAVAPLLDPTITSVYNVTIQEPVCKFRYLLPNFR